MARRLSEFPADEPKPTPRPYPWEDWTDGSVWEIRRGEDYDAETEDMRGDLHAKADAMAVRVRTKKVRDENGEGLVFQFFDPGHDEQEANAPVQARPRGMVRPPRGV